MTRGLFIPIDTGQKMPPELLVWDAQCPKCGAFRQIAHCMMVVADHRAGLECCAECMADIVSGMDATGLGALWAEVKSDSPDRKRYVRLSSTPPT